MHYKNMKENEIIERLKIFSNRNPSALEFLDDIAKIDNIIISTDTTIDGVHILPNLSPKFLAYKALARGVSDIIAKGGKLVGFFMNLILPYGFSQMDELLQGLEMFPFKIDLLGGDTSAHNGKLIIVMTVIGKGENHKPRTGAKIGDGIYITKKIGCAYCGYIDTKSGRLSTQNAMEYLMPSLIQVSDWASVNASMDISDGLLADAQKMALASQKCFEIDFPCIPFAKQNTVEENHAHFADMLSFGDDYNVLVTSSKCMSGMTRIGSVVECSAFKSSGLSLKNFPFEIKSYGFEHQTL